MLESFKDKIKVKDLFKKYRGEDVIVLLDDGVQFMFINETDFDIVFAEALSETDDKKYMDKLKEIDCREGEEKGYAKFLAQF